LGLLTSINDSIPLAFGGFLGFFAGLPKGKITADSIVIEKKVNVKTIEGYRLWSNSFMKAMATSIAGMGTRFSLLIAAYSAINLGLGVYRQKFDSINTIVSSTFTGLIYLTII